MLMLERRRVTLFDFMALIAATAVGLWLTGLGWPSTVAKPNGPWALNWPIFPNKPSGYPSKTWMLPVTERAAPFLPCLAAWTGAFLAIRLHGPRPRRRRLVIQPGLVAAVAVLSILAAESVLLVGSAKLDGRFGWSSPTRVVEFAVNGTVLLAHHAGWSVVVAWLTLGLIGRWRPEPSWVDRCGRTLGCLWIGIGPAASLLIDHTVWWGNLISG